MPRMAPRRLGFPRLRKGKDPGSAFGPEYVPLATGLVPPLSTGCPGPLQAQPPVQPDERSRPLLPVLVSRLALGRLAAGAPAMT